MKKIFQKTGFIKNLTQVVTSRLFYLILGIMLVFTIYTVQAVINSANVSTGNSLTATMWNQLVTDLNWLDTNKQNIISGSCPAGSSIGSIATNGSVTCETDNIGVGRVAGGFQDGSSVGGATCENAWGSGVCSGGAGVCNTGSITLIVSYNVLVYMCVI